jgi:hypothetical protein
MDCSDEEPPLIAMDCSDEEPPKNAAAASLVRFVRFVTPLNAAAASAAAYLPVPASVHTLSGGATRPMSAVKSMLVPAAVIADG